MPRSQPRSNKLAKPTAPTSKKLDLIDQWLQKMLDAFPQKGTITTNEIEDWHRDLAPFSEQAIDYAFETHRRNAIFFPMYGQIIDCCIAFSPPGDYRLPSIEARAGYGKSYNMTDFYWMLIRLNAPCAVGPTVSMRKQAPTAAEWNALLDACDMKRYGGAPESAEDFRR